MRWSLRSSIYEWKEHFLFIWTLFWIMAGEEGAKGIRGFWSTIASVSIRDGDRFEGKILVDPS